MEIESLLDLISNRNFDKYRQGLEARFESEEIKFPYDYALIDFQQSLTVILEKDTQKIKIVVNEKGVMIFVYHLNGKEFLEKFKNCNSDDFHRMLAHACIFKRWKL